MSMTRTEAVHATALLRDQAHRSFKTAALLTGIAVFLFAMRWVLGAFLDEKTQPLLPALLWGHGVVALLCLVVAVIKCASGNRDLYRSSAASTYADT